MMFLNFIQNIADVIDIVDNVTDTMAGIDKLLKAPALVDILLRAAISRKLTPWIRECTLKVRVVEPCQHQPTDPDLESVNSIIAMFDDLRVDRPTFEGIFPRRASVRSHEMSMLR